MAINRYISKTTKSNPSKANDIVIHGKGRKCTFTEWTRIRLSNKKKQ